MTVFELRTSGNWATTTALLNLNVVLRFFCKNVLEYSQHNDSLFSLRLPLFIEMQIFSLVCERDRLIKIKIQINWSDDENKKNVSQPFSREREENKDRFAINGKITFYNDLFLVRSFFLSFSLSLSFILSFFLSLSLSLSFILSFFLSRSFVLSSYVFLSFLVSQPYLSPLCFCFSLGIVPILFNQLYFYHFLPYT